MVIPRAGSTVRVYLPRVQCIIIPCRFRELPYVWVLLPNTASVPLAQPPYIVMIIIILLW